jgi:Flp pilus assembly protein TadD
MAGRAAVVIGINYETQAGGGSTRAGLTRLRFAEADARDVAAELTVEGYDVRLLLGAQATERTIRSALTAQRKLAGADGLLLVHFSGHGDVDPDDEQTAYLLPVDTDPDDLGATAIPLRTLVHDYLGRVGSALALLDCCHSGWALGFREAGDRGEPFRRQVLSAFNTAQGRVVLTACPGDDLARELAELQHGVFTHYLLAHWRGWDDEVTAESLFAAIDAGLEGHSLPRPVMGGTHRGRLRLRAARMITPPPAPQPGRLSQAEVKRRERLHTTLNGLSETGWIELLKELGEDPAAYGRPRAAAARRLTQKLADEGMLRVLIKAASHAEAAEQAAAQAAQVEAQHLAKEKQAAAIAAEMEELTQQFEAAQTRQDWYVAIARGERILRLDPQQVNTRVALATAYHKQSPVFWSNGEYDHAILALTRAIDLDPQNARYHHSRGVIYQMQGDPERAITDKARAIDLDPQNGYYYFSLGLSYLSDGDAWAAQTVFERATALGYWLTRGNLNKQ